MAPINIAAYDAALRKHGITRVGLALRTRIVRKFIVGDRLLDVGCADGSMLRQLSTHFRLAIGIEPHTGFHTSDLAIVRAMGELLPFADQSFDSIVCSAARKHMKQPLTVIREMVRTLRPNGRLIILDPNPILVRIGAIVGKFDSRYIRHNSWSGEIRSEMEACGLKVIHSRNGLFVQCVGEKPSLCSLCHEN